MQIVLAKLFDKFLSKVLLNRINEWCSGRFPLSTTETEHELARYLRQGGYVFASVSLFVCLFVCLSSTLRKKLLTNFYENFRKGPERAKEQSIRFGG